MGLFEFLKAQNGKKLRKDQWAILFLAGILLLVIAVPTNCGGSSKSEGSSEGAAVRGETQERQTEEGAFSSYREETEARLEQALSSMEGVGRVKVMITLKDEGESVVEKDQSVSSDSSNAVESDGGRTQETVSEQKEETVYRSGTEEGEPFVSKRIAPEIDGVFVAAEGGGNLATAKNISEAVQALFSVEAHKIKVVKMNSREGSN